MLKFEAVFRLPKVSERTHPGLVIGIPV
jgi:hypothetical protein